MHITTIHLSRTEDLQESVLILMISFATLCYIAYRMKFSVAVAAVLMLIGCGIAIGPDILSASKADLGDYGNRVRELGKTDHSDAFIAITSYMYSGRGKLLAFAGMSVALICYASIAGIRRKSLTVKSLIVPEQTVSDAKAP